MADKGDTYTIVVNKEHEIVSVTKNGVLMELADVNVPNPNFKDPPPNNHKLKHGCIGLGMAYEDEGRQVCRWLWGTWW